jgi:hypothetical protein
MRGGATGFPAEVQRVWDTDSSPWIKFHKPFEGDKLKLVPPVKSRGYGPRGACFSLPPDFIHGLIAGEGDEDV